MKRISISFTVLTLAGLLAACGGNDAEAPAEAELASTTEDAASESVVEAPVTPAAEATETEGAEASPASEPAPVAAENEPPKPAAVAAAKAERPANFALCGACHKVEPGQHGIGPSLAGVFGRKAGQAAGFEYSLAMKNSGLTWNAATLDEYLQNPRAKVPDTTMIFVGEKNADKRQALIDYLKSL